ncbi:AcrR family transcriptional regulator [Kitasatospora sp. MAA4]|uniref:TetR/AcrR family transcriptional regulator n=1 Tax=Kitasatospora sp. MAA4 TaxID=3035093 RepID=UPI0024767504|nr:TetR/AcrR family transcriptional regulator [Kitasatospora sp. MAA4]MDH6134195.1 AcrR family transcriptional regulator [Kitasatospora sp. MAA4]
MTERHTERGSYHHGALPEALVAAALALLDEAGQDRVTMREVARRAGVSAGAPFRHFPDRQALLTEVADRVLADFEQWQLAEIEGSEGTAMRALGLGFVRYAIHHPHRFALVRSRVFTASRQPELRQRLAGIDEALTEFIVADQHAGQLRPGDPALVALAGQALTYGLAQMIIDGYLPPEKAEELTAQVLDTFGKGIANPR